MQRAVSVIALATVLTFGADLAQAREHQRSGTIQGAHRSGSYEQTINRSRGNYNRNTTLTGENGRSANRQVERTWDRESGTGSYERSATGPEGRSRTAEGTFARTEDGHTRTGSWSNSAGGSGEYTRSVTRGDEGVTHTHEATRTTANGKTVSHEGSRTREDGTISYTHSVTSPKGNTHTRSGTVTPDRGK